MLPTWFILRKVILGRFTLAGGLDVADQPYAWRSYMVPFTQDNSRSF